MVERDKGEHVRKYFSQKQVHTYYGSIINSTTIHFMQTHTHTGDASWYHYVLYRQKHIVCTSVLQKHGCEKYTPNDFCSSLKISNIMAGYISVAQVCMCWLASYEYTQKKNAMWCIMKQGFLLHTWRVVFFSLYLLLSNMQLFHCLLYYLLRVFSSSFFFFVINGVYIKFPIYVKKKSIYTRYLIVKYMHNFERMFI